MGLDRRRAGQPLRRRSETEASDPTIERQRARAQNLGHASGRRATGQLHLEQSIVGVQPAERRHRILRRAGFDRRYSASVEAHFDRGGETGQHRRSGALRPAAGREPEHHAADDGEDGDEEDRECGLQTAALHGG
jgi:hypothetical protein